MKKVKAELEDTLRIEYDLKSLRVRKIGTERKSFFGINGSAGFRIRAQ